VEEDGLSSLGVSLRDELGVLQWELAAVLGNSEHWEWSPAVGSWDAGIFASHDEASKLLQVCDRSCLLTSAFSAQEMIGGAHIGCCKLTSRVEL
jgi:hypothetical protein